MGQSDHARIMPQTGRGVVALQSLYGLGDLKRFRVRFRAEKAGQRETKLRGEQEAFPSETWERGTKPPAS